MNWTLCSASKSSSIEPLKLSLVKGQLISKANCHAINSSKERTHEFVFISMRHVFVCFLEEIEDSKKAFRNYLTIRLHLIIYFGLLSCYVVFTYLPGHFNRYQDQPLGQLRLSFNLHGHVSQNCAQWYPFLISLFIAYSNMPHPKLLNLNLNPI